MSRDRFQKYGHPGKYISVVKWEGGQLDFTGSADFIGGIIVPGFSASYNVTDVVTLTGGGSIPLPVLAVKQQGGAGAAGFQIHELSIAKISGSIPNSANDCYLFTRNPLLH
jgi:hypothetical protein